MEVCVVGGWGWGCRGEGGVGLGVGRMEGTQNTEYFINPITGNYSVNSDIQAMTAKQIKNNNNKKPKNNNPETNAGTKTLTKQASKQARNSNKQTKNRKQRNKTTTTTKGFKHSSRETEEHQTVGSGRELLKCSPMCFECFHEVNQSVSTQTAAPCQLLKFPSGPWRKASKGVDELK